MRRREGKAAGAPPSLSPPPSPGDVGVPRDVFHATALVAVALVGLVRLLLVVPRARILVFSDKSLVRLVEH